MKKNIPPEVLAVVQALTTAGYQAYLVGGCVRDMLRNATPKDWDATTNATPEQIQALFPDSFYENDFGTVGVKSESENPKTSVIEVTPYRTEGEYNDARRPSSVAWAHTIQEDLSRRDFTINAIAYDPVQDTLVDPYGGNDDIRREVLKTVGDPHERFAEDALRMLRGIRLSCELNYALDSETLLAISTHKNLLAKISRERIRDELVRIIMSPAPLLGFSLAQKLGLLPFTIPELERGVGCAQNQAHSFDVFEHLLRSMQHAADKNWPKVVRVAALLHDIGKPESRRFDKTKNDYTFHGHEVIGARMTKKILTDLRFPKEDVAVIERLVRWHMFFADPEQITLSAVRRIIRNVGVEHIHDLLHVRMCDRIGTGRPKEQPFRLRKYMSMVDEALRDPISVTQLKINGAVLMQEIHEQPGPRIGWMLHALLEEVLDEPSKNTPEYLLARAQQLHTESDLSLKERGLSGKDRREEAEEKEIAQLRKKHYVD